MTRLDKIGFLFVFILVYFCTLSNNTQAAPVSESEQAWLDEHSADVYFAPIKDYPPFLWSQYGALFGISYDYLNYIQEKLSISFPKREPRTREEIINALKAGESSFVSALTQTTERSEYLLFTRPYISLPTVYVGKSGTKARTSQEIIERGLRVSVGGKYGLYTYLKERYPEMLLVPVENNYVVLQNVLTGITEIGALNVATLVHLVREHDMRDLKKLTDTGFEIQLSFAVPKANPELRNILDNIIESMPKNTKNAIISRWITDTTSIENLAGTQLEDINKPPSNSSDSYLLGASALLLLCLGFILHYIFVRFTPKKSADGHNEYIP